MSVTKIICTTSDPIFKLDSSISLNTLDISSQENNKLIEAGSKKACCYLRRCEIDKSVDVSLDNINVFDINLSSINVNKQLNIDSINHLNVEDSDINLTFKEASTLFPFDSVCEIDASDVNLFDVSLNVTVKNDVMDEVNSFVFSESYIKEIKITYKMFYDNSIYNTLVFGDEVTCDILGFWYGGDGLVVGGTGLTEIDDVEIFQISIGSSWEIFGRLLVHSNGIGACSNASIGLFIGGRSSSPSTYDDDIEKMIFSTKANATFYGNLTEEKAYGAACSNGFTALFAGGQIFSGYATDTMEEVSFSTESNSTIFGILTVARNRLASCSNKTVGVWAGGYTTYAPSSIIDYISFASLGNATFFGNLSAVKWENAGCSNETYGLFAGDTNTKEILKITFSIQNEVTYFGDLAVYRPNNAACSDGTIGLFIGGGDLTTRDNVDKLIIDIESNATNWGDIRYRRTLCSSCSGN